MATDLNALRTRNLARWAAAKLTRAPEFVPVAKRLVAAKARYQVVEAKTGVPWHFIAVTHQRESSQNWNGSLAQGDPWNKVSTHVPKGRGPFKSWEEAAIDALVNCAPYTAKHKDWSIGGLLTILEQYNGLGYANKGVPSPYIWSGTDQYRSGKYVRDHVYDPSAVDKQLGCAGLLLAMRALDPSIYLGATVKPPVVSSQVINAKTGTAGAVVVAGGVAAQQASASGVRPAFVIAIGVIAILLAVLGWIAVRHFTKKPPGDVS